jgi:hypothetical protein
MSTENEIREIASRNTWDAAPRAGETMAIRYELNAIVEICYHEPIGMELLGLGARSGWAQITTAMAPPANEHLISIDDQGEGHEDRIVASFITFDVVGIMKSEGGWPAGTFGAQGAINSTDQRGVRSFATGND